MALTWGDVKQLMRLHGVARHVAALAHEANRSAPASVGDRALSQALDDLMQEVQGILQKGDRTLAGEFERVVIDITPAPLSLAVRAAIFIGWLEGAVEAETLEVRMRVGEGRPRPRKAGASASAPQSEVVLPSTIAPPRKRPR